jgi:hypothetical protein
MKDKLKFKKLMNEFRSLEYEYEYNREVVKEVHGSIDTICSDWCKTQDIDFNSLKRKNSPFGDKPTEDDDGSRVEVKAKKSKHKDIFKKIAKKFHPDKLTDADPRQKEFRTVFQKASSSVNDEEWGGLFDIADKYDIELADYEEINTSLEEDLERVKEKLKKQKTTYSWYLQNCNGEQDCIDMVINAYMRQTFEWDGPKST